MHRSIRCRVRLVCASAAAVLLVVGAQAGQPGPAPAAPLSADSARAARAQAKLEALLAEYGWPGATLGWVLPDGRVESVAAGVTDVPGGRPMRVGDRIFSGSIGKTYVAAVMLQLVAEQKASLDDPVSRWLGAEPWFGRLPNASALTLRMLLAHTSGIGEHIQVKAFQDALAAEPLRVWNPAEMVAYVLDATPLSAAGSSFSYADTNYILVGMIIEKVTGRSYYEVLAERVLEPLGLAETTPADRPDLPGLVCGHTTPDNPFRVPDRTLVDGRYPMNPQVEWTGGGLITTAADLARWARALYAGNVLAPPSQEQMLQAGPSNLGPGVRYGLGVITWEGRHGQVWGHFGWVPGYHSGMAYFPALRLAAAFQVNSDVKRSGAITRAFLDDVAAELVAK